MVVRSHTVFGGGVERVGEGGYEFRLGDDFSCMRIPL